MLSEFVRLSKGQFRKRKQKAAFEGLLVKCLQRPIDFANLAHHQVLHTMLNLGPESDQALREIHVALLTV
jgi:hypothetical protein